MKIRFYSHGIIEWKSFPPDMPKGNKMMESGILFVNAYLPLGTRVMIRNSYRKYDGQLPRIMEMAKKTKAIKVRWTVLEESEAPFWSPR